MCPSWVFMHFSSSWRGQWSLGLGLSSLVCTEPCVQSPAPQRKKKNSNIWYSRIASSNSLHNPGCTSRVVHNYPVQGCWDVIQSYSVALWLIRWALYWKDTMVRNSNIFLLFAFSFISFPLHLIKSSHAFIHTLSKCLHVSFSIFHEYNVFICLF